MNNRDGVVTIQAVFRSLVITPNTKHRTIGDN